ncbi:hypothetical protein PsorP6_008647 [Peronosclerospora sorghi]|uniref:Uncharacterized protein n=1 Tax=Peronosclerospora sorghi TaxID=230839 RepID=A0ACC0WAR0_9STRA|nr:hypothetical protein PsorP6_008647 [Peronosclerospora sorghi]
MEKNRDGTTCQCGASRCVRTGAGGNGNIVEVSNAKPGDANRGGARYEVRNILVGDETLGAEYQENDALLLRPEYVNLFDKICKRENCPYALLGQVTGDGRVVRHDSKDDSIPFDLDLDLVQGKMPQNTFKDTKAADTLSALSLPVDLTLRNAPDRVLTLLSVGSKRFLTSKVDRSVSGLIEQQQTSGLLQLPLANCAVIASVMIAYDLETIWRFMPVFTAADLLQRAHEEFFEPRPVEVSLFLDKDSTFSSNATDKWIGGVEEEKGSPTARSLRCTRSGRVLDEMVPEPSCTTVQRLLETLESWDGKYAEAYAVVQLVAQLAQTSPSEKIQPLSSILDAHARLARLLPLHTCFVRIMKLFWRWLAPKHTRTLHVPSLADISRSSDTTFEQIWRWCVDRTANKMFLACAMPGDKCEHTEGCCEAYVASMFILQDGTRWTRLIELPLQYDELYISMTGRHCTRCMKTPCDPGLCLICDDYL